MVSCLQDVQFSFVTIDFAPDLQKCIRCLRGLGDVLACEKGGLSIDLALKVMRTAQAGIEAERLFSGRYLSGSIGREITGDLEGEQIGFLNKGTETEFIGQILDYVCGPHPKEQVHVKQWGVLTVRRWLLSNSLWIAAVTHALLERRTLNECEVRELQPSIGLT